MNNRLTAFIVDDEKDSRDLLKYLLLEYEEIKVVDEAADTSSALLKLMELKPDLVFLDLVMPGKNGIELIKMLKKQKLHTKIVIVSAYKYLSIDAIRNDLYDFILKPVTPAKLQKVISKIKIQIAANPHDEFDRILNSLKLEAKLRLSSMSCHLLIKPEDILYCEAEGSYTKLHMDNGTIELTTTYLGKVEEILSDYHFFRIGRSLMVNLDKLWRVDKSDFSCILFSNKKEVKLYGSKRQIRELCKIETSEQ